MIDAPSPANRSIRLLTVSIGTGSEVLSYSLQYLQDRLQRRIGTMCASIGCFVESNPRVINFASRRIMETFFIVVEFNPLLPRYAGLRPFSPTPHRSLWPSLHG